MADFTRLALFTIAENAGWVRGEKVSRALRITLRSELLKELRTPGGRRALEDAPRIHIAERGEMKYREMNENDAVNALLEELEAHHA